MVVGCCGRYCKYCGSIVKITATIPVLCDSTKCGIVRSILGGIVGSIVRSIVVSIVLGIVVSIVRSIVVSIVVSIVRQYCEKYCEKRYCERPHNHATTTPQPPHNHATMIRHSLPQFHNTPTIPHNTILGIVAWLWGGCGVVVAWL